MKNVLQPLAKSLLILLRLTAAASAAVVEVHKNFRVWNMKNNNVKEINGTYYENSV